MKWTKKSWILIKIFIFFQIQIFTCPYLSNTRVRQNLTQIHFRLGLGAESITNVRTLCRVTHITALPKTSHYVPVVELSQIDPFFMAL